MGGLLTGRLMMLMLVCLLVRGSVGEDVDEEQVMRRCYDCQHCEKTSSNVWKSVDCGNGTCAKRVVTGYVHAAAVHAKFHGSSHSVGCKLSFPIASLPFPLEVGTPNCGSGAWGSA